MATPGERIEQERTRRGLSRDAVSEQLGGTPSAKTIERIEKGARPNSKLRFLVEEFLGITDEPNGTNTVSADKQAILRSASDVDLASEQLRRAHLRAEEDRSDTQPKRGRRAVAPGNLTEPGTADQAHLNE